MTAVVPAPPPESGDAPAPELDFSSRRPLFLGFLTLLVLCGGTFGWGAFASIEGAVIGTGQVEVESRDQVVEHLDGGTVGAVLVKDGDRVEADQVLVRLSGEKLQSEAALLEAEHTELVARRNRLEAEFRNADAIVWDPTLAARAQSEPSVADVLEGQRRLFHARRDSRAGQVAQLAERIGQTRKQVAGLEAQAEAVGRQSRFLVRELAAQRELFDEGRGRAAPAAAARARSRRARRTGRRDRGPDCGRPGPNCRDRAPDPADRRAAHRGGRGPGARGPCRGVPGVRAAVGGATGGWSRWT